jgi:phosphoribosylanthranilate isomerase
MRVRIKICGITDPITAVAASDAGVDAVGFVFHTPSPRNLEPDTAADLARHVSPLVTRVAVFCRPGSREIIEVASWFHPHVIQVEPTADVVAAIPDGVAVLPVFHEGPHLEDEVAAVVGRTGAAPTIVLEAAGTGGRGRTPDWDRAAKLAKSTNLVLAGGLSPDNAADAIRTVRPWGVDVSSGVESSSGIKDPKLIVAFVAAVREAEREMSASMEVSQ